MPLIWITFLKMLKVKVGNGNMSFTALNFLSYNNYCSVGVVELCLLNFCVILTIVWSLRACHMWLTRNHVYSWNFGTIYLVHFLKFSKLTLFTFTSKLGKFIPNFPLKHVITSTNSLNIKSEIWMRSFKLSKLVYSIFLYKPQAYEGSCSQVIT